MRSRWEAEDGRGEEGETQTIPNRAMQPARRQLWPEDRQGEPPTQNPPHETCPEVLPQAQQGRSLFPSWPTTSPREAETAGGIVQAGIHKACPVGPKPLAQPPALPPQDPGQWAGEGGVILYPSHKPQGSTTGRPRIPGGSGGLHERGKEGKEAGWSQPQPGASATAPGARCPRESARREPRNVGDRVPTP